MTIKEIREHRSTIAVVINRFRKESTEITGQIINIASADIAAVLTQQMNLDEVDISKHTHIRYIMDVTFDGVIAEEIATQQAEPEAPSIDEVREETDSRSTE